MPKDERGGIPAGSQIHQALKIDGEMLKFNGE
jgi:hypothetical protein